MAQRGPYAKGIARREEILVCALDAIGRRGYRNTSLKQIADDVGVSQAALLHYFGSKEELFTEVLRARDDRDAESVEWDDVPDPRSAFVEVIRRNAAVPGVVELFSRLAVDAVDPTHPAHSYFLERSARLRRGIAAAVRSADRPAALDPETMARVVQAVADGLQLQWLIDPDVEMAGIVGALIDALHPAYPQVRGAGPEETTGV